MDTPQPTPSPEAKPEPIQLLPLKEGGENEKLANMLALLMASEGADPAEAANSALRTPGRALVATITGLSPAGNSTRKRRLDQSLGDGR
jgi:hypothetical protein